MTWEIPWPWVTLPPLGGQVILNHRQKTRPALGSELPEISLVTAEHWNHDGSYVHQLLLVYTMDLWSTACAGIRTPLIRRSTDLATTQKSAMSDAHELWSNPHISTTTKKAIAGALLPTFPFRKQNSLDVYLSETSSFQLLFKWCSN